MNATDRDDMAEEIVVQLRVRPRWKRCLRLPLHTLRLWLIPGVGFTTACRLAFVSVTFKESTR